MEDIPDDCPWSPLGEPMTGVLECSPIPYGVIDPEATIVWANRALCELLGYTPDELAGRTTSSVTHPDDRTNSLELARGLFSGRRGPFRTQKRYLHRDGSVVVARLTVWPIEPGEGQVRYAVGAVDEVVAGRDELAARLDAERAFRHTIEATPDAFVAVDAVGCITGWNRAAEEIFGYPTAEALGHPAIELVIPPEERRATWQGLRRMLAAGEAPPRAPLELRMARRDGTRFPAEVSVVVVEQAGVTAVKAFVRDVSDRRAVEHQLATQALADPLTGLANRVLLRDRLARALRRLERGRGQVGVLFLDIDRFKVVNDSLGHDAGDDLLRTVAGRIGAVLRPVDTVARFGGDEFVVVSEGLEGPDEVLAIARRITEAISVPVVVHAQEVTPTASMGIALSSDPAAAPEHLIRDADLAMYRAKASGHGIELFHESMRASAVARLAMEAELRHAIDDGELRVHYQPIVTFDGELTAVEALVRWEHPERGLVNPAEFIPLAEETGLVVRLGEIVLRQACRDVARWRARHSPELGLTVNISARQLADPGLVRHVAELLAQEGLTPGALCLEITESSLMADTLAAAQTLAELRRIGVQLAIDDFGTGYSSLLYLRRFPVQVLKLDRFFIAELGEDTADAVIVGSVIELAHALGLRAVAEGVETAEQVTALRRLGCDLAQGYHWSRPVPADVIEARLAGEAPPNDAPAVAVPTVAPPPDRHEPDGAGRVDRTVAPSDQPSAAAHRVVMIDDSPGDRSLLRHALAASGSFVVVAEADDAGTGIAEVARHRPDLVLLDLALPGRDGLEALADLQSAAPEARVVIVSGFVSASVVDAALLAGAAGCVDKSLSRAALIRELEALAVRPRRALAARGDRGATPRDPGR